MSGERVAQGELLSLWSHGPYHNEGIESDGKRPNRSSTLASDQPIRPQCGSISNLESVAHNGQLRSVVRAGVSASTTCHPIRSHIARRRARSRCRRTHKPDLASVATYVTSPGS